MVGQLSGDFVKFNNNNIWEIVKDNNNLICYKREIGLRTSPYTYKYNINEDRMGFEGLGNNFNYLDWKAFYGEERLKKVVTNLSTESSVLPLIYFISFYLGYSKYERIRSTKWRFLKSTNEV